MKDLSYAAAALERQGVFLPPEHQAGLAETAAALQQTVRRLEQKLSFDSDLYGFLALLKQEKK